MSYLNLIKSNAEVAGEGRGVHAQQAEDGAEAAQEELQESIGDPEDVGGGEEDRQLRFRGEEDADQERP